MKTLFTTLALLAAWATMPPVHAAVLPAGTVITGTASGASSTLLGLDAAFAPGPTSHVTTLAAADLEYLSGDFAIGIDFFADGTVQFYDNTGNGLLPGSYSFTFTFAGLADNLGAFAPLDLSAVLGGNVSTSLLGSNAVGITLTDLQFSAPYASFSAQLQAQPVPEPATPALAATGLGLVLLLAARRRAARGV